MAPRPAPLSDSTQSKYSPTSLCLGWDAAYFIVVEMVLVSELTLQASARQAGIERHLAGAPQVAVELLTPDVLGPADLGAGRWRSRAQPGAGEKPARDGLIRTQRDRKGRSRSTSKTGALTGLWVRIPPSPSYLTTTHAGFRVSRFIWARTPLHVRVHAGRGLATFEHHLGGESTGILLRSTSRLSWARPRAA